jgi:hypothetical protein
VVKNIDSAEKNITPALTTRFARSVHEFSRVEFHPCSGETSTAVEIACIAVESAKLCLAIGPNFGRRAPQSL